MRSCLFVDDEPLMLSCRKMNGAELLLAVRALIPPSTRILLTGQAGLTPLDVPLMLVPGASSSS